VAKHAASRQQPIAAAAKPPAAVPARPDGFAFMGAWWVPPQGHPGYGTLVRLGPPAPTEELLEWVERHLRVIAAPDKRLRRRLCQLFDGLSFDTSLPDGVQLPLATEVVDEDTGTGFAIRSTRKADKRQLTAIRNAARRLRALRANADPQLLEAIGQDGVSAVVNGIATGADNALQRYQRPAGRQVDAPRATFVRGLARLYRDATGLEPGLSRHHKRHTPQGPFFRLLKHLYAFAGPPYSTKGDEAVARDITTYR
jgi:hypothetical protein